MSGGFNLVGFQLRYSSKDANASYFLAAPRALS
jgi:hypothetical protein